jgi:hypothetical protein
MYKRALLARIGLSKPINVRIESKPMSLKQKFKLLMDISELFEHHLQI